MSDPGRTDRERSGERGFTLIELLVVVTIIGILAAIVSVSVAGFTGKASVQAHKTTITAVQAAVDAFISDHYDGSGALVAPTGGVVTISSADSAWYDRRGVDQFARPATDVVYQRVLMALLTASTTTVIANTTRTHGPYLRLGGNASVACVFENVSGGDVPTSALFFSPGNETYGQVDRAYRVLYCRDTAQTAQ